MIYRNFRLQVCLRVILLTLSILLFFFLINLTKYTISLIIVVVLIAIQTILLIKFVERINKKLKIFLDSIRHSDFSSSFTDQGLGRSFDQLNHAFQNVILEFKKNRAEKEEHYNYLQTVVQHVSIGIIAFKRDGKVDMFNNAVKKILKINNLRNVYELDNIKDGFSDILIKMKAGDKFLVKIFIEDELLQLSIYATEFRMRDEEFILISLQNIHAELEEKEIESWQKLIRVLTHEIMNSITPISSLASTVQEILIDEDSDQVKLKDLDDDDVESVQIAMNTIHNRSQGLLNFVDIYRNLTRIPKPNFRYFKLSELFERTEHLLRPKLSKLKIKFRYKIFPEDIMLTADPDLIDQVVINLILNAIDAVKKNENPQISLIASKTIHGKINIDFVDNGYGIKPDILDKIFMPFFTSKREGSGIGLSLSRQIMHLHKGTITVKSKPNDGCVFTLTF
ncbi:MAG: hypothetical protein JEY97_08410 [Bacteroidales bacterium]|nr:hypothetical protein [Bacteroidales bacterium]